jgi:Domain of unknown function (DUF6602)
VDWHGNHYYQYRHNTERFSQNTDRPALPRRSTSGSGPAQARTEAAYLTDPAHPDYTGMAATPARGNARQKGDGMAIVEEYWSGVLNRLQSEVDVFNELITHAGERGRENELSFARILASLIPRRYGVGSGLLIDSEDHYSKQTDIVIYNQADEPAILAQTSQIIYPVECTRACLEVKTRLGSEEIKDAGKKRASVFDLLSRVNSTPLYGLIAYKSTVHSEALVGALRALPPEEKPDLVCVLGLGFMAGYRSVLDPTYNRGGDDPYLYGNALLQGRGPGNERIPHHPVEPLPGTTKFAAGEISYPVVKLGNKYMVAEPSRSLLIFCEALVRNLAHSENRPTPAFSYYITDIARELTPLG